VAHAHATPRLLITGGSGNLGGELMRLAAAAGWHAVGTSLTTPGFARLDVCDGAGVDALVARVRPDVVIQTAYQQRGDGAREVTVDGAAHVARAARRAGARLLHLSTDVVFDGQAGRPYVEEDGMSPITGYGRAKAAAERLVAAAHPDAAIVRTSLLWGGSRPGAAERAARDAAAGRGAMAFFTDELRCPIHVGDLAGALLELALLDVCGPVHVAGADAVSRLEFAELVSGRPGLPRARSADQPEPRPLDCRLDCSRAHALLQMPLHGIRARIAGAQGASRATVQRPEASSV
jgi:dTDP-4-dehydrorhamnose reductase